MVWRFMVRMVMWVFLLVFIILISTPLDIYYARNRVGATLTDCLANRPICEFLIRIRDSVSRSSLTPPAPTHIKQPNRFIRRHPRPKLPIPPPDPLLHMLRHLPLPRRHPNVSILPFPRYAKPFPFLGPTRHLRALDRSDLCGQPGLAYIHAVESSHGGVDTPEHLLRVDDSLNRIKEDVRKAGSGIGFMVAGGFTPGEALERSRETDDLVASGRMFTCKCFVTKKSKDCGKEGSKIQIKS